MDYILKKLFKIIFDYNLPEGENHQLHDSGP